MHYEISAVWEKYQCTIMHFTCSSWFTMINLHLRNETIVIVSVYSIFINLYAWATQETISTWHSISMFSIFKNLATKSMTLYLIIWNTTGIQQYDRNTYIYFSHLPLAEDSIHIVQRTVYNTSGLSYTETVHQDTQHSGLLMPASSQTSPWSDCPLSYTSLRTPHI